MAEFSATTSTFTSCALVELTGNDRLEWLQGQATNDLRGFTPGQSLSFCLCEPTGQLLAVLDAWAIENRILLTMACERVDAVLEHVERMTILEDVAARNLTADYAGFAVRGNDAEAAVGSDFPLPKLDADAVYGDSVGSPVFLLRSVHPLGGWDVWIPNGAEVAGRSLSNKTQVVSFDEEEALRIVAGIPAWGEDMGPRTLPPELGADFEARHISYTKGCYTGQEVLMRMHSRGHTNRTWVGLVGEAPMQLARR